MSKNRSNEDPSTESSSFSARSCPSRYRLNPCVSDSQIHNINPLTSSDYVLGISDSLVPASVNPTSGPCDSHDHKYLQTSALSYPPQHSADPYWDMGGRPLDRPRSRQPSNYGSPLLTNADWNRANEYAEAQQPQALPQVNDQQRRFAPAATPGTTGQSQSHYAPPPHLTGAALPVPAGAVGVVQEVTLETHPVVTEKCVPFTTAVQPPVTTIQATATQISTVPDQGHTITHDQLKTIKERRSDGSSQPKRGLSVSRNDNSTLLTRKIERKTSFRGSLGRAGRTFSKRFLDALRLGKEPAVVLYADTVLDEWNTYLLRFNERHTKRGEAFDPFQDQIEEAFDVTYRELLGVGKFLIDEEESDSSVELPVQEVRVVPTEVAEIWLAHRKAEEAATEVHDFYTGSVRRRLPASELVVRPPKPRTYPAGPPPSAPAPEFMETRPGVELEGEESDQRYSIPDPVHRTPSVHAEAEVENKQPETPSPPTKERQSRLPRPSSMSGQRPTNRRVSAVQPVEVPKHRTPSKTRKDSTQTGSPTTPALQHRAQSRDQERYPKVRNIKK